MKKISKNGFVLAETIIVGVFIMGILATLIINVLPLVGDYERLSNYDNLDKIYAANDFLKYSMLTADKEGILALYDPSSFSSNTYNPIAYYYIAASDEFCDSDFYNSSYCDEMVKYFDIKKIVLTRYNMSHLKEDLSGLVHDGKVDRGLADYIKYLPTYDSQSNTAFAKYKNYKRLILEFNDGTYASIEVDNENVDEDE